MPVVSIVILNWNGIDHLPDCLASLKIQTFQDFECIVVDNGSTDASVAYLKSSHPWVRLVSLHKNHGFASGNVIGLKSCTGKYIVTLNNDTIADRFWLQKLVKAADDNPEAGMVGCRICSNQNRDIIDSIGVKICLDGMSRGAGRGKKFSSLRSVSTKILMPSACAALYRRTMLDETGFFDEAFFAYCEDTDLGLRGRLAGWGAVLAPDAIVYHKYSATAGTFSPFKLYLVERNHFWVAFKSFPPMLLLLLPITTLMRYLLQIFAILRSSGSGEAFRLSSSPWQCLVAVAKGLLHGLLRFESSTKTRSAHKSAAKLNDHMILQLIRKNKLSILELLDVN